MSPSQENSVITGNYFNKYETRNPLFRLLVNGYKNKLQSLVNDLPVNVGLEIGSGEGVIIDYVHAVRPDITLYGSDITHELVLQSARNQPNASWNVLEGEHLPFPNHTFDVVFACEVLEHLNQPDIVLQEVRRVTKKYVFISVPQEPVWRVLNVMRLKYLHDLGNTPGHLQHWSVSGIQNTIGKFFEIERVETAFPWTFVVGYKK